MGFRLVVAVSGHGFGHLAQVAPIVNTLYEALPGIELIVRTTLPRDRLMTRLRVPFTYQRAADDFGMLQHSALQVDVAASMERYRQLHRCWDERVAEVAEQLRSVAPDLLFADVPYLTLAAARMAGIPAVAMCSLNWLEIFSYYCAEDREGERILEHMQEAYNSAEIFLRCEPAMPFPGLGNVRDIGLVAAPAANRRIQLEQAGWLRPGERLVLVAMGGIDHRLALAQWPRVEGVRFVVPQAWSIDRGDCFAIESSGLDFAELLASCDAVITKPGYGTFADAAVNGIPVIYVERQDGWPEQAHLTAWLQQHIPCYRVDNDALARGDIGAALEVVFARGRYPALPASGVSQAVAVLRDSLVRCGSGIAV